MPALGGTRINLYGLKIFFESFRSNTNSSRQTPTFSRFRLESIYLISVAETITLFVVGVQSALAQNRAETKRIRKTFYCNKAGRVSEAYCSSNVVHSFMKYHKKIYLYTAVHNAIFIWSPKRKTLARVFKQLYMPCVKTSKNCSLTKRKRLLTTYMIPCPD